MLKLTKAQKTITVGTRVKFSQQFLRSLGAHTGWHPFAKGVITSTAETPLYRVHWDGQPASRIEEGEEIFTHVNVGNIIPERQLEAPI